MTERRFLLVFIPITVFILSIISGVVVSILLYRIRFFNWNPGEIIPITLLFIVCIGSIIFPIFAKTFDVFEPVNIIVVTSFISIGVASLLLISSNMVYDTGTDYRPVLGKTVFYAFIAFLAFEFGYYILKSRSNHQAVISKLLLKPVSLPSVFTWALIGLFLSIAGFFAWVFIGNVPLSLLNTLSEEGYYRAAISAAQTNYLFLYNLRITWPGFWLLLYVSAPQRIKKWLWLVWLALLAIYIMLANRGIIFRLILLTVVFIYLTQKKRPSSFFLLSIVLAVVFMAGTLVIVRSRAYKGSDIVFENIIEQINLELTYRGPATGMMKTVYVFPEKSDFLYGKIFEELVFAPIPRAIWPEKPIIRNVLDIEELYIRRAHATTFYGVFYAGFGVVGIIISMALFGYFSAEIYNLAIKHPESTGANALLAIYLALLWELYQRGGVVWGLFNVLYTFAPVLFIIMFASPQKKAV